MTGLVVFFAIAADLFVVYQFNNYETMFLELYGAKQDGYLKAIM